MVTFNKQRFEELLLSYAYTKTSEEKSAIELELWEHYGAEGVVLILDMSGFSLLTQRYGVIHYLSMVRRMQMTVEPIITERRGRVVKFEADNCFARFETTAEAIDAAIEMNRQFDAINQETPDQMNIRISCGIDGGRFLLVEQHDFFGNAVNRASKLGEDIAQPGEILVTQEAMEQLPEGSGIVAEMQELSISGILIQTHAIQYER